MKQVIAIITMALMLGACAAQGTGGTHGRTGNGGVSKQSVGTIAGGAAGAIAGSNVGGGKGRIAAIAIGTLLGAALGSEVGASLDRADMVYYNQTSQQALEKAPSGQTLAWQNPDTGHRGTVTPVNVYENAQGEYCREYSQTITVGGQTENAYGKACRQPDGTWRIVE